MDFGESFGGFAGRWGGLGDAGNWNRGEAGEA
jgi:hypothetical protein